MRLSDYTVESGGRQYLVWFVGGKGCRLADRKVKQVRHDGVWEFKPIGMWHVKSLRLRASAEEWFKSVGV